MVGSGEVLRLAPVTAMIFTLNEEIHLPSCLASLAWCGEVVVIDSYSQDRTEEIALRAGARFLQHTFTGFGDQRNWALENADAKYEWVLILDADERVPVELANEISLVTASAGQLTAAFRLKRRFYFHGKWIRYSSLYPTWVVRLVRRGRVRYINRGHAETQEVAGQTAALRYDLIDENLKGDEAWHERQRVYAKREARYELSQESVPLRWSDFISSDPLRRRAALKRIATCLPARPLAFFLYSYVWRLGFLDGIAGYRFCRMKAGYHRMILAEKRRFRRESP